MHIPVQVLKINSRKDVLAVPFADIFPSIIYFSITEYLISGGPAKSWNPAAAASETARLTRSLKMGTKMRYPNTEVGICEHLSYNAQRTKRPLGASESPEPLRQNMRNIYVDTH